MNRLIRIAKRSYSANVKNLQVQQFLKQLNGAQILDVREPNEFADHHFKNSTNVPLSSIQQGSKVLAKENEPLYVLCQRGKRAATAADILAATQNFSDVQVVEGGINAIREVASDQIVSLAPKSQTKVWSMERQVRCVAGGLVAVGSALTLTNPAFVAIPFFIGGGLVYSAVSDTCGMAAVLAKMPWNTPTCKK